MLAGLDEDIFNYIVDMLEGDEERDEMQEPSQTSSYRVNMLAQRMTLDKCSELFVAMGSSWKANARVDESEAAVKLLDAPTSLAESDEKLFRAKDDSGLGGKLVDLSEALDNRKKRKAEQEAERKATNEHYNRIVAQRAAEEERLQSALTTAVTLRRERGAYTGSVEAKPFSLANPGGGRDLLENASFTLVRGRIYGLIEHNRKGKSAAPGDCITPRWRHPGKLTVHYLPGVTCSDTDLNLDLDLSPQATDSPLCDAMLSGNGTEPSPDHPLSPWLMQTRTGPQVQLASRACSGRRRGSSCTPTSSGSCCSPSRRSSPRWTSRAPRRLNVKRCRALS